MRNLKLTRVLLCFALVFMLSITTASAKMFGTKCRYDIVLDDNGDCQIYMERTTYFFWIPSTDAGYYSVIGD